MTLLNNLYITFGIFLRLLIEVKSQTTVFNPGLREGHTTTFINDKLYILGGVIPPVDMTTPKETFFYLNFSAPFNTNRLKWTDLSNKNDIPPHRFAAAIKGGADNSTLFLCGGESIGGGKTLALVYTFDTRNNLWRIPKTTGIVPIAGALVTTPIIDYNGLIYLFGGRIGSTYTNNMFVFDTINFSWKRTSSFNAPSPRNEYGAVFLPNGSIIYMGGFDKNIGALPLDEVYLYNTNNDVWTTKKTYGSIPFARYSISSVLGLDGQRVIVFGGFGPGFRQNINNNNSIYVLNTGDFNWYIPKVTGRIPSSRGFHKAVLIGKYMVITYGRGYTQGIEDDILLLDISNNDEYIWTSSFDLLPPVSSSPVPSSTVTAQPNTKTNKSKNTDVIAGATIGSLTGCVLLSIGGFFLYKWHKNKNEQNEQTPNYKDEGEGNNHSPEMIEIPRESYYYPTLQVAPPQTIYNHGQEIPDIRSSVLQNDDYNFNNVDNRISRNLHHGNHGREIEPINI